MQATFECIYRQYATNLQFIIFIFKFIIGFDHINRINIFNEESARDYLSAYPNNWPRGLQDIYAKSQSKIPIRFIIVDDSGSVS